MLNIPVQRSIFLWHPAVLPCTTRCQHALCGDGIIWEGEEECDDVNELDGDGCSNTCQINISGECMNEDDRAILDNQSSLGDQIISLAEGCAQYLLLNLLDQASSCLSSILVAELGLSASCSDCFGDFALCLGYSCFTVCNDGINQGCMACLETEGCIPNLTECAGPVDLSAF